MLGALFETAEAYMVCLIEGSNLCTIHAKWVNLMPHNIHHEQRIWDETNKNMSFLDFEQV